MFRIDVRFALASIILSGRYALRPGCGTEIHYSMTYSWRHKAAFSLVTVCSCVPQVDYEKLAELAGLKNDKTASAVWGPIKKKLLSGSTNGEVVTPKSSKAKGAKAVNTPDGEDEATPTKTIVKKPRKTKSKATAEVKEEALTSPKLNNDDDAGEVKTEATDDLATPTKAAPRKRVPKAKADPDDALVNGDSPIKKRSRKAKGADGDEPKTPAKRAKKTPAKNIEASHHDASESASAPNHEYAALGNEDASFPASAEDKSASLDDNSLFDSYTSQ